MTLSKLIEYHYGILHALRFASSSSSIRLRIRTLEEVAILEEW